jgi:hypothetical protein
MKSKEELKKLFENGDKPTQENFWEWQDSYWHKDEKLPTDNAGLYKIKGSVDDKAALDALTGMSEGDVYNLLDTGANYVYVLDLNNTGEAGWDDFFGTVDLSSINLQTVLDNSGVASASDANSEFQMDLEQRKFLSYQSNDSATSSLEQIPSSINLRTSNNNSANSVVIDGQQTGFSVSSLNGETVAMTLNAESALHYAGDYSAKFIDRSLVDKGYVDNALVNIPINATLQTVLTNNPNAKVGNNVISLDLTTRSVLFAFDGGDSVSASSFDSSTYGTSIYHVTAEYNAGLSVNSSDGKITLYNADNVSSNNTSVVLDPNSSLVYENDYSSRYTERSLVDRGYVDNATSTLNYLPLSGTEVGKPLTGNVALSYTNFISGSGDYQSRLEFVGDSSELFSSTPMFTNSVRVSSDAVVLRSDDLTGAGNSSEVYVRTGLIRIRTNGTGARGLTGDDDYTANITALDYVQKKYVDDAIANSTTPIEEIVLAGSNGLTGKIRYEKRGEFMNIHVDITVGKLQVDESFSTILPFDLKTSFIIHPMITDIVNYFYTDIIIKTDGNELLFINKTDAVITGGLIKQSFVFALGAD